MKKYKFKTYLGLCLYYCIGRFLPKSHSILNIGQKNFRYFSAKLFLKGCGINVNIEKGAIFSVSTVIGDNSGIGINCRISSMCTIGKNVLMGPNCIIYTQNHRFDECNIPIINQGYQDVKPVYIGDDVWIGSNVTILPGVRIGNHCIIGTGAIVTKNIPDWAIAAGNPAEVKKFRN